MNSSPSHLIPEVGLSEVWLVIYVNGFNCIIPKHSSHGNPDLVRAPKVALR